ncbi:zinc/iron-chelating domain-containing protein [Parazoarcus communis]|uniref:Zinc/iron-chelating domain-containing protein n=1 Tax=Parazoarcus communis TaxID=41977 RepID=A0A2U8GXW3_9RHOO|nr:YkgJ family cysteine cluster protein [Parazoarcus communis]AWI78318.1 zinc/iron-chelating domain-containing protein [Parazoarcus communis]
MPNDKPLFQLHAEIDTRVQAIRAERTDWLCGKGCDSCCRRLADIPRLTAAEWALLQRGLKQMTAARLEDINRKVAALASTDTRPVVCPLLDEATGACPVYAQRPVACRTYGFYVQRELGLYCSDIELQVTEGMLSDVVWGNHDAIDQQLSGLGDGRPLTEWWLDETNRKPRSPEA